VVAINTTPHGPDPRKLSLGKWITRTQAKLAFRSRQDKSFHKIRNLFLTKRLIDVAIINVVRNEGARTAGIDGMTKKDLKTEGSRKILRERIYRELKVKGYKPSPVRRVYIPKANGKVRPLGIPTIKDRVIQEMLRLILEPIYEPHFYAHSYGFRPYRCTHHAALRIKDLARKARGGYRWAIEGDIEKCFDNVDHEILLRILKRRIKDGFVIRLIRDQLKAGIMESEHFYVSEVGTPQGGIVSPLLANIYLNELDTHIAKMYEWRPQVEKPHLLRKGIRHFGHLSKSEAEFLSHLWNGQPKGVKELRVLKGNVSPSTVSSQMKKLVTKGLVVAERQPTRHIHYRITPEGRAEYHKARRLEREKRSAVPCHIIRYADDFVIVTQTRADAERIKEEVDIFLRNRLKLKLSKEKTLITHLEQGINFLGLQIKVYPKYRRGACLIKPSPDKVEAFKRQIKTVSRAAWKSGRDAGDITRLNEYIVGWGNYYRHVSSARVFRKLDRYIWHRVFKDTYKAQAASRGRFYSKRKHYRKNYIPYSRDIKRSNRWRRGRNYGRWADEARTCAHILVRLSFLPIQYAEFHPQLNPYFPEERAKLEENKRLLRLTYDAKKNLPMYNADYGHEWLVVRLEALRRYKGRCAICGKILRAYRFADSGLIGHHITPLKAFKRTEMANLLENIIPVCPACHNKVERA